MQSSLETAKHEKVLVYLIGSLGDTIVAIPALRAIRRHFPQDETVMLQNVDSDNLVKASDVIPKNLIDRYLNYSNGLQGSNRIAGFLRLWKEIRVEKFQSAVYLVISERPARSVVRDKLFFWSCGIQNLIGFHSFSKAELYPVDGEGRPAMTKNEAVRKLSRIQRDGIRTMPDEDLRQPLLTFSGAGFETVKNWLTVRRSRPHSFLFAIAPGSKTKANAWPLENFIEIGRRLITEENCEILIIGGKGETESGEKMLTAWGSGINATGKFSVRESGALLSMCDLYIGLDTGTTHLAAAVGTSCFALYGERNNPGHWFPLGEGHTVVFHQVECAGCRLFDCPVPDHPCMNGISVEFVWRKLQNFISFNKQDIKASALQTIAL